MIFTLSDERNSSLLFFYIYNDMKIFINNKETETTANVLSDVVAGMNLPERGVAVAVNQKMIQREEWGSTPVTEDANILIIKAACGG